MTQARTRLTLDEYLALDSEGWVALGLPEGRCEYVGSGELNVLPSESELNDWIAQELFWLLATAQIVSRRLIRPHSCEIEVTGKPKTRYPDLVILREEHINLTQKRLLIRLDMPPPRLIAEVVSPREVNRKRDYEEKRKQYQERGVPEYWLIDPENGCITVLKLMNEKYVEHGVFRGEGQISSLEFGLLPIKANQILEAGQNFDGGR
ncbi:Uma2 family endonuclease [bacterium]|nr:Uma2 family endonuclease [bacterium]